MISKLIGSARGICQFKTSYLYLEIEFQQNAKMATKPNKQFSFGGNSKDSSRSLERRKKSLYATNGLTPIDEGTDGNSESSFLCDRKVIQRSALICSDGSDKYNNDCSRNDIPFHFANIRFNDDFVHPVSNVSMLRDRNFLYSEGEVVHKHPLVKRNSVVYSSSIDTEPSHEEKDSHKCLLVKRNSIVHPENGIHHPLKDEVRPKSSLVKRNSIVHPNTDVHQSVKDRVLPKHTLLKRNSIVRPGSVDDQHHSDDEADLRGSRIKRNSVVHPGNVDLKQSLCINGKFQNPWPTWRPPSITNILKFGLSKDNSKVPCKQELDLVLPIIKPQFSRDSRPPEDGIRITWIGHSTVLVQMHGLNILTDPMFSDRASPSQVVGPKRYRNPPCTIHDLPHINAVVISHSHYDHLDLNTVIVLNARFGTDIRWFVPLGLLSWMQQAGCENVVELNWWEENCVPEHSDTFFTFTPAQHWSKRTITDDNKVLWGSWCVIGPKYRFFFAGDTGYCDVFKQIGKVHGPFDVSAIPIGAFEPRWFMKYQHVNPDEAVKIHMDVKSKYSVAIHWGTFSLANEYYLDPPVKLREGLEKYNIPTNRFFTMKHGESRVISQDSVIRREPTQSHYR